MAGPFFSRHRTLSGVVGLGAFGGVLGGGTGFGVNVT